MSAIYESDCPDGGGDTMTPDEAVAVLRNYTDWVAIDVDFFDDALDVVASLARDHAALLDWAARAAVEIRKYEALADSYADDHASAARDSVRLAALYAEWAEMQERERTGT